MARSLYLTESGGTISGHPAVWGMVHSSAVATDTPQCSVSPLMSPSAVNRHSTPSLLRDATVLKVTPRRNSTLCLWYAVLSLPPLILRRSRF